MSLLLLFNQSGNEAVSGLVPTLADIGALLHARTTIAGGDEAGTFTDETHPTAAQVQTMIDLATPTILIQLPATVPVGLYGTVRLAAALQVAVMIERSYFPEQVAQGASPVDGFETQLATTMAALISASLDNQAGGVRVYSVPITTPVATYAADPSGLLP